jgi:hypothetical protein
LEKQWNNCVLTVGQHEYYGKPLEKRWKNYGKPWKNMNSMENLWKKMWKKTMESLWKKCGKTMENIWTNMNNMKNLWQNMERHGLDNRGFPNWKTPRFFILENRAKQIWKTVEELWAVSGKPMTYM